MSDLDKNRALVEWLEWQLRQTKNRVRELEVQEEQERRRKERARAEMSWKIQPQRTGESAMLHRGGCTLSPDYGFINREEAMIALAEPDIEPCQICHPETGLT
jgi:TolA-binding protein